MKNGKAKGLKQINNTSNKGLFRLGTDINTNDYHVLVQNKKEKKTYEMPFSLFNTGGGGGDEHENINIIHTFTLSDIGASDSEDEEILNNLITDYIESLNITVLENEIHYFQLTDYNPTSSGSPFTGLTTQNSNSINFSGLGTPASPLVANVIQGQILISSSITLNGTHNNKILIVTSDNVTITVNNTLPDDFECSIFTLANNTMFIGSSISFFGNSGLMELEINRSATIVKINNTNDIILRGELS